MAHVRSHYENLKVARNAPPEVIRAAYRALAQKYHPDRNLSDSEAVRVMAIVNEAYRVLSDPMLRKQHDDWIDEAELGLNGKESAPSTSQPSTDQDPIKENRVGPTEVAQGETIDLEVAYERFTRSWPILAVIVGVIVLLLLSVASRQ